MAILRPLAEIAANSYRKAVDAAYQGVLDTICDDYSHIPAVAEEIKFVPCREGRSIHSPVSRRFISKRKSAGRMAGHNNGRDVYYNDEL